MVSVSTRNVSTVSHRFTVPGTIYQYDVATNSSSVYAAPKVNFDASKFITEQVFFSSKDGAKIPMFLTYKKDLRRNGKSPCISLWLWRFQYLFVS